MFDLRAMLRSISMIRLVSAVAPAIHENQSPHYPAELGTFRQSNPPKGVSVHDGIVNMMSDPAGQWIVSIILSIPLMAVILLTFKILWALPPRVRRTLLVLVVLFFPLIFLFLACTSDPDD
jgi:hypothetical protein